MSETRIPEKTALLELRGLSVERVRSGWRLTTQAAKIQMSRALPGLGSFYLAGQWVEPGGGTPAAVISSRGAIQIICKTNKKRFVAGTP